MCKTFFPSQNAVKVHIRVHKRRIPCKICGQPIIDGKNIERHRKSHDVSSVPNLITSNDQFQCNICKKYFPTKFGAIYHIKRHETRGIVYDANGKRISHMQCDICKMQITTKPKLMRHMITIHGSAPPDAPHICAICKKGFVTEKNLAKHMGQHNEPKFICSYCGKKYRKTADLRDHLNGHMGLRPHKCTECGNTFAHSAKLRVHMRIHTGIKPYICSEAGCDRAYAYRIDLNRHLWGQHKIYTKKHPCSICGKIFPENKILVKHIKNHP